MSFSARNLCFMIISLVGVFCMVGDVQAQGLVKTPISPWSALDTTRGDTQNPQCAVSVKFTEKTTLVLSRNQAGLSVLLYSAQDLKGLVDGMAISLFIDGANIQTSSAQKQSASSMLLYVEGAEATLNAVRHGTVLSFIGKDIDIKLSLAGSRFGITQIESCYNSKSLVGGFDFKEQVRALPRLPIKDDGHSYVQVDAPQNVQNTQSFRPPAKTFIKVFYPDDIVRPNVETTDQLALAPTQEVKPTLKQCFAGDFKPQMSLLRQRLSGRFSSGLQLVSGQTVDFTNTQHQAALKWHDGIVNASLVLIPDVGGQVDQGILKNIKKECRGSFALQKARDDTLYAGLRQQDYHVACVEFNTELMGVISFISDGFETAIFSFESDEAGFDEALIAKDSLLQTF